MAGKRPGALVLTYRPPIIPSGPITRGGSIKSRLSPRRLQPGHQSTGKVKHTLGRKFMLPESAIDR